MSIHLERKNHIGIITLNRPEKRNAFNEGMWSSLEQVASELKKNLPRVVILTGAGNKAFCAGFDVNPDNPQVAGLINAVQMHDEKPAAALIRRIREAVDSLVSLPVPIIAAINGLAYGGGAELTVRCDLRVMDPDAIISFSEVRLGLMPDWGGGVGLTRLIGSSRAADLILTARKVGALEALQLGVINRISKPGESLKEAIDMGETIAKNGPKAIRHALELIRHAPDISLREALDLETALAVRLIASGECVHGITAFLSKKEPEFPEL